MTVNHPQWGTMCEICYEQLAPYPDTITMSDGRVMAIKVCAIDELGQKWGVCKGACTQQAGIVEQ